MLQHFSYYPCFATLYICQLLAYGRLKAKKKFNLSALKVVAVAYERREPILHKPNGFFWASSP